MKNERGVSLVELLMVVAILGIIASIALPKLTIARQAANEAATVSTLRSVASAEVVYSINTNSFGSLADLGASAARLIDSSMPTFNSRANSKSGYFYGSAASVSTFQVSATRVTTGAGRKEFIINEVGAVLWKDNAAVPLDLSLSEPRCTGCVGLSNTGN